MRATLAGRWLRRAIRLLRRHAVERALEDEMRYHIDCATAEHLARGMTPAAARRQALVDFGSVDRFKEEARDARGARWLEDAARDLRYGARVLRHHRAYALSIVITIAASIAIVSATLSVVHAVLLEPLPYADPDRLVVLWEQNYERGRDKNVVAVDNFEAWRTRTRSFSAMAALVPHPVTLPGDQGAERIGGADVSPEYFALLGVQPVLGRGLRAGEQNEVVLSDAVWRRRFGSDSNVLGRALIVSGVAYTIVGVMPPGFDPPRFGWLGPHEFWFPFIPNEQNRSWGRSLLVVARLAPDATIETARAELGAVATQLERESAANRGWTASIVTLREEIAGKATTPLIAVTISVSLLVALSIFNISLLTAAFAARREHQLLLCRALGATDERIARQLLAQSVIVIVAGVIFGVLLSGPSLAMLLWGLPATLPRADAVVLDGRMLAASVGVVAVAVAAFTTWIAYTRRPRGTLAIAAESPRVVKASASGMLVATQIAIGVAISIIALLTARSFASLQTIDLGFMPQGVITARVALSERYDSPARQASFYDELRHHIQRVPGVSAAGFISTRPFGSSGPATIVHDARRPAPAPSEALVADIRFADLDFFAALQIPFVDVDHDALRTGGAVVTKQLANAVWPNDRAVGQRLRVVLSGGLDLTVAAVAADVHLSDSRTPARAAVFVVAPQFSAPAADVIVRVHNDPLTLIPALRAAASAADATLPLYQIESMQRIVDTSIETERSATYLLGAFAFMAAALASIGVFGLASHDAAARRREICVRIALGATWSGVLSLFVGRISRFALLGIVIGSSMAFAAARLMSSLLFRVSPADPATFATATAVLLAIAVGATVLPAFRALRSSSLTTLRDM